MYRTIELTLEQVTELLAGKKLVHRYCKDLEKNDFDEITLILQGRYMTLTIDEWRKMRDAARFAGMHKSIDMIENDKEVNI